MAAVSATVTEKVSAWLGGQLLLGGVIGLTSAIGLGLMGVPYFYVLALISAIGELIPMLGPILAAIPAILVAATVSPGLAVGVAVFFIIQQQLENTVLVPKIMGRQVGLSAVTVIVALGIGSQLLGVRRRDPVGADRGDRPGAVPGAPAARRLNFPQRGRV